MVIVGGGFGGVYAAKHLLPLIKKGNIGLTIISRNNYFLFTPLLHEVATGGLSPNSVAESLQEVFREAGANIIDAEVTEIDREKQTVRFGNRTLSYDYLVSATGAETEFHGVAGAREYALPLKSLLDAVRIRGRIIEMFEKAARSGEPKEKKELLSFAVAGGGPTGVEFTAELAEFACETLSAYFAGSGLKRSDVSITLASAATELLGELHPAFRRKAAEALRRKGVKLKLGTRIKEVTPFEMILQNEERIPELTVFWLAGVRATLPRFIQTPAFHPSGRVTVDECLRLSGEANVFVLGDAAAALSSGNASWPLPMLAQVAAEQGKIVAKNIGASIVGSALSPFVYRSKGMLISLGQWKALGEVFGVRISGALAWFIWRTIYLFKFLSWRKRFKIASEWTARLFYPRDITKID